jgi:hypothetical protein
MRAGKVYMKFSDGVSKWVSTAGAAAAVKAGDGEVVPRVRMKVDGQGGPIVREFNGARVPMNWQDQGSVMAPDDSTQNTPVGQSLSTIAKNGMIETARMGVPMLASSFIPGVGALPALGRAAAFTGVGGLSNMGADAALGEDVNPQRAFSSAALGAAAGVPFEAAAVYAPKWAPRMVSDVLRPSPARQKELEAVATRQGTTRAPVDYDRAAQQLLAERTPSGGRVMPDAKGAKALEDMNDNTNKSVNDILDDLDAAGFKVRPGELAGGPEIRQLRANLAKRTDAREAISKLNAHLKEFMSSRVVQGVKGKPATGPVMSKKVTDQYGNPVQVSPGKPAVKAIRGREKPMTATRLGRQAPPPDEGEKAVWRRGASVVNKARAQGTSTDKNQEIGALVDDALARAAVRKLEGTGMTTADPERAGRRVGISELNDRLERRIPASQAVADHLRRSPVSIGERIGMMRGRLPFPDAAVLRMGYNATDPSFVRNTLSGARGLSGSVNELAEKNNK